MEKLQRIASIILAVLASISVVIAILFYAGGSVVDPVLDLKAPKFTQLVLNWAYVLVAVSAVLTLVFSLGGISSSKNGLRNALISLGAGVVLFLIAFGLGSSDPIAGNDDVTASTLKWVDTGLIATYILAGVAFVGIIASEVIRAFK